MAQVTAIGSGEGLQRLAFAQHLVRKLVGNAVVVDGDERDVTLVGEVAEPVAHAGGGKAAATVLHDFGFDQFAVERLVLVALQHLQFVARLLVHRNDAGAEACQHAVDAQHLVADRSESTLMTRARNL
jgi:hypothetical protein